MKRILACLLMVALCPTVLFAEEHHGESQSEATESVGRPIETNPSNEDVVFQIEDPKTQYDLNAMGEELAEWRQGQSGIKFFGKVDEFGVAEDITKTTRI